MAKAGKEILWNYVGTAQDANYLMQEAMKYSYGSCEIIRVVNIGRHDSLGKDEVAGNHNQKLSWCSPADQDETSKNIRKD